MRALVVLVVFMGFVAAKDSYTWTAIEGKKIKGLTLTKGLSLADAKSICLAQGEPCVGLCCKGDDMCRAVTAIGKKKNSKKYTIYKKVKVDEDGLDWHDFSKAERLDLNVELGGTELYYLRLPCSTNVHFKLFLFGEEALNGHVEWSYPNGNIYCRNAGNKAYYDGAKTDFTLCSKKCNEENTNITLIIEQTANSIAIKNEGKTLYSQSFGSSDGDCGKATTRVVTQVWNDGAQLSLAALYSN